MFRDGLALINCDGVALHLFSQVPQNKMSIYVPVCTALCLSVLVCLSVCLSACLSVCLSVYLCV